MVDGLRKVLEQVQQQVRECLVCLDAPRASVLEPCRHAVACADCAALLQAQGLPCPICREPIASVRRKASTAWMCMEATLFWSCACR